MSSASNAETTVLVVDDSPTERRVVVRALEGHGFRIVTAADGEEALERALAEQPKVVLLDVILPKKNGFQVCRQLKTSPVTQDIKVILLTSKSGESDRYWGLKQGADAYVSKPFETTDLLESVQACL